MKTMKAYNPTRRVGMEIVFQVVDQNAADSATVTAADKEGFSRLSDLVTGQGNPPAKYATMEDGLVQTDGTWDFMPDNPSIPYWSSSISGADGTFARPPVLTIDFSKKVSTAGITMKFDPEAMPKGIFLTFQDQISGRNISSGAFTVDSATFTANIKAGNYDRLYIRFDSTREPYRRARMYKATFGLSVGLTDNDFVKATIKSGCSPACKAIPSAQLSFVVDNSDKQYNMLNPSGFFKYLQEGQPIETFITVDDVKVNTGRFFFTSAKPSDDALTAQIVANDKVLTWDGEDYDTGVDHAILFRDAIKDVLGTGYDYDIPDEIGKIYVTPNIKKNTKKREAVRLLCLAARCTCWIARNGVVTFRDLSKPGQSVDTYDADNMPSMDGMNILSLDNNSPIDKIVLKNTSVYTAGTGSKPLTIQCPCATPSTSKPVAEWLLSLYRLRVLCDFANRGNPAILTGDTVTVYNAFGQPEKAVVYDQTLTFDGGLSAKTKALGREWK